MTPLGALNFVVLQWFGVRLARVTERRRFWKRSLPVGTIITAADIGTRTVTVGWTWLRWVWPLTGWWSDYRWIARRR